MDSETWAEKQASGWEINIGSPAEEWTERILLLNHKCSALHLVPYFSTHHILTLYYLNKNIHVITQASQGLTCSDQIRTVVL